MDCQSWACRLARGGGDAKLARDYAARAKRTLIFETAATAWGQGVPWAEALATANKVMEIANPAPKAVPKGKAAAKAAGVVPKRKAKAKAKAQP